MDQLVTCRACDVHVRRSEPQCPFCGAASPSDEALEIGPRARTSRAMLHRLHAAAMATCALACDHGQSASSVTIEPTASSSTPAVASTTATATATATVTTTASATASTTATATATATVAKHAVGGSCATNNDCASGLSCCTTGMSGACGGRARQMNPQAVCNMIHTCVTGPCMPMAMPPYGGAFPNDSVVV